MRVRRGSPGKRLRRSVVAGGAIVGLFLVASLAGAPIARAEDGPVPDGARVSLDDGAKSLGDVISVHGTGWGSFTTLSAAVCGNRGFNGSADCISLGRSFLSQSDGTVRFQDVLTRPPSECPCVVRVRAVDGEAEAVAPIDIVGMPALDATQEPVPGDVGGPAVLSVDDVRISGGGWQSWFGLPTERTLRVVVTNRSAYSVVRPPFSASWGRDINGENLITTQAVDAIGPGETVTLTADLSTGPLSYGSYGLTGHVGPSWAPSTFSTTFDAWPWALLALVALGVAVWVRRRIRRRRARRREDVGPLDAEPTRHGTAIDVPSASVMTGRVAPLDAELLHRLEEVLTDELRSALARVRHDGRERTLSTEEATVEAARLSYRASMTCSRRLRLDAETTRGLVTYLFAELCELLPLGPPYASGTRVIDTPNVAIATR